ncbi:MAG: hypothetical protein Q6370_012355 [Candidatus Sigynarchaeota archaeon]
MKQSITFTGVIRDTYSCWSYGFYRVKPDSKIPNPNIKSGKSSTLVYLLDRAVREALGVQDFLGESKLVKKRVRVQGHWFTRPLADRHYFQVTGMEILEMGEWR